MTVGLYLLNIFFFFFFHIKQKTVQTLLKWLFLTSINSAKTSLKLQENYRYQYQRAGKLCKNESEWETHRRNQTKAPTLIKLLARPHQKRNWHKDLSLSANHKQTKPTSNPILHDPIHTKVSVYTCIHYLFMTNISALSQCLLTYNMLLYSNLFNSWKTCSSRSYLYS